MRVCIAVQAGGYFSLGVCITTWWLALAELVFDVTGKVSYPYLVQPAYIVILCSTLFTTLLAAVQYCSTVLMYSLCSSVGYAFCYLGDGDDLG